MLLQECYRPVDPFLQGHDLVLQAEEDNCYALINAVMASTARHPLWLDVIDLMMERASSSHNPLYAIGSYILHTHMCENPHVFLPRKQDDAAAST